MRRMREGYGLFSDGQETCELLSQRDFVARLAKGYSSVPRIVLATAAINCANGGVLAPSRQALASVIAKAAKVPFYIAGESFRSAGVFPLPRRSVKGSKDINDKTGMLEQAHREGLSFIVSYGVCLGCVMTKLTILDQPADHIEALFLDKHVCNPTRLSDEIIKSWF